MSTIQLPAVSVDKEKNAAPVDAPASSTAPPPASSFCKRILFSNNDFGLRLALAAGLFCGAQGAVAALSEEMFAAVFCKIPAWIAAAYFQAKLDGETLIFASGQAVRVTRECGGADFFSMLCALLAWQLVPRWTRWIVLFPLAAWSVTMLVNAMRVIATVWTRTLGNAFLPERLEAATHLFSGVLIFFPSLLAVWLISKRLAKRGSDF